jgi:hypothetical protein
MLKRHSLSLAIMLTSLSLVACNSNDDDNANLPSKAVTTTTITVTPSLGKILNAKVSLRNAKTNTEIASAKALDANGVAKFTVPITSLSQPILATVVPNDTGDVQYFDEATNALQTIAINAANRTQPLLRAAATVAPNANIGVTALTEAAVQTAAAKTGGLAVNIDAVNQLIKTQLQLSHSILQAPLVIGSTEQYNQLASTAIAESQRVYAAYLANLAKQAALLNPSSTQPAFDMAQALAADFKDDSNLNASFDASKIAIAYSSAFATAWLEAFSKVLAALKNLPSTNPDINSFFATAGQNVAIAQPIRVVDGVAEYACADESKLRSNASQSMNIDFINQSGGALKIFWLDYSGQRVSYNNNLANTQTHAQGTFLTHPWVVTDSSGVCKGIYRAITRTNKMITFKTNEVVIGGNNPVVGNQDTCASLNVNPSTLAAIEDFVGNYEVTASGVAKANFQVMANGDISLKGQTAQFKEVCKNPTQNNGQGYRLITTKATILLFRQTDNALLAEGKDFANASGVFEGYKIVSTDPLKPIRTINGVEEYRCDSWTKIANGTADGTPTLSFVNQLGANTSLSFFGLNSINRTTTLFSSLQNNATYKDANKALKNQFVRVDGGGGECKGVFKAVTNTDKTITFKTTGVEVTDTAVANNCTSQGADNKLGFTNAPTDFCGFTKATSTAISNPDTYNFFNADKKENVEVTVVNNAVTSVSIENDKYGFACGVGFTACSGVTLNTANTNTIEFVFNNTALSVANGASQGITVKNGSLIHQKSTGGSGSSSLAFNSAKCTQASSQTAFGMTAIAYNLCASDAVGDFSLTAQDNNTFSPTHDGIPCTITKVGSAVTLTKGAKSLTVQFNGDSTDVMTLRTGALTDAQVENDITARTAVGDPAGQTVRIEIRKNGTVASAQAQNIQGNESFGCVAL